MNPGDVSLLIKHREPNSLEKTCSECFMNYLVICFNCFNIIWKKMEINAIKVIQYNSCIHFNTVLFCAGNCRLILFVGNY